MVYAFSLSYSPEAFTAVLGAAITAVTPTSDCSLPPSQLQRFLLISLAVLTTVRRVGRQGGRRAVLCRGGQADGAAASRGAG